MLSQPKNALRYVHLPLVLLTLLVFAHPGTAGPVCELMWGTAGSGLGEFNGPVGIEVPEDPQGGDAIFVVDQGNHRIQVFTGEGYFIRAFGGPTLDAPSGIDSGSNHLIYVTDTGHNRVVAFQPYGGVAFTFGQAGTGDGEFDSPTGICVTSNDNIYVADRGNHRIQEFTLDGTFIRTWGSRGSGNQQFNSPVNVGCTPLGDRIFVADAGNSRIQVFDSEGLFVDTHRTDKIPSGLDIAEAGDVYLATDVEMIHYDASFQELGRWGESGTGPSQFSATADAALGNAGDIYVVDRDNSRIQKFAAGYAGLTASTWGALKQRFVVR